MAFNPFHGFRKHRKKMFAIMTIICMFIFIFSSGLGGKADLLNMTFLSDDSRFPAVAKLDGRTVNSQDLELLRRNRQIANEYMRTLVLIAADQVAASVRARAKDMDPVAKRDVEQVVNMRQFLNLQPPQNNQMAQQYDNLRRQNIATIGRLIPGLEAASKTEDLALVRTFHRALQAEYSLLTRENFFDLTTRRGQDLLDFLVWRRLAEERDITLTPDAVRDLIRQETFGQDVSEQASKFEANLKERYHVSQSAILDILADEFRVRAAQVAVLGGTPASTPSYVTPHEFYKFYLDQRTAVRVGLLPVSAEAYLDKVAEKPADKELRDLFQKYARQEPNPESEQPGFKVGRKVKLEWVGVKADNPLLKKAALDQARKDNEFAAALQKALYAPPAADMAGVLARTAALRVVDNPDLLDKRIDREYEIFVGNQRFMSWVDQRPILFTLHARSLYQPAVIAGAIGDALAGGGTRAVAATGPVGWGARAIADELRERVRFGLLPLALAGPNPHALLGVSDMMLPQPPSRAAMGPMLREKVVPEVETAFINAEFTKFQQDLQKKSADAKNPEALEKLSWWERWKDALARREAARYVDDFVKKYGLRRGASAELRDRFGLADDPGLKPLREAYLNNPEHKADRSAVDFGSRTIRQGPGQEFKFNTFFGIQGFVPPLFQAGWFDRDHSPFPNVDPFGKPEAEFYMAWKTEEIEPRVRKFEEARADVERAWKLARARDLARQDAEAMQKELRDKAIRTEPALKDYALQHKTELIEVGPIAKAMEERPTGPLQPVMYTSPKVPADKVPYAGDEFADKLVELRDKPIGETVVLPNAPKTVYYVGVLTERNEPSMTEFESTYARAGGDPHFGGGDQLLELFEFRERQKLIRATVERLRAEARLEVSDEQREELKKFDDRRGGPADEG